jgi:tetratricopeptide (TPR) repeat protein
MAKPDSVFHKANSLYQQGRYEEAIDCYDSLVFAGFESQALYYNMGNAYFRSNKLGKARLYYEKTLKMNPRDEDALTNLNYLEPMLVDRFEKVPVIFYKNWIQSFIVSRSSNQWAYISVVSLFFSILSLVSYLLLRTTIVRKIGFYSAVLFFLISFLSFYSSWKQNQYILKPNTAVVTDLSVNVKSAPHETGTGLFILHEGAKVWLEDKTANWIEIRLSDGRKGWVPESSIQAI